MTLKRENIKRNKNREKGSNGGNLRKVEEKGVKEEGKYAEGDGVKEKQEVKKGCVLTRRGKGKKRS